MSPDSDLLRHLACPACHTALQVSGADCLTCPADGLTYPRIDGIWRMLRPDRAAHFAQFVQDYETIRRAEQRGSDESATYRALPYCDLTGRWAADWAIRAGSFETLIAEVVTLLEADKRKPLRILDTGAGNGWLSYRLALRGHQVAAIDLQTNTFDGLGAHIHYDGGSFLPIQAEFDGLPFVEGTADLAIYNASLHYSEDIGCTLSEALHVLKPEGLIAIVDSPIYRSARSGQQMVGERERQFAEQFGFPSNALSSENYLTYERLDELAQTLGLRWRMVDPRFGWRWQLRRWRASLAAGREAAQFRIVVGRRA